MIALRAQGLPQLAVRVVLRFWVWGWGHSDRSAREGYKFSKISSGTLRTLPCTRATAPFGSTLQKTGHGVSLPLGPQT